MPASVQLAQFRDPALVPVGEKVLSGRRLDRADALALYETGDLLGLGSLAAYANEMKNGDRVFFSANQHINPTNVCVLRNTCTFCSFARMPGRTEPIPARWKRCTPRPIRRTARRLGSFT